MIYKIKTKPIQNVPRTENSHLAIANRSGYFAHERETIGRPSPNADRTSKYSTSTFNLSTFYLRFENLV